MDCLCLEAPVTNGKSDLLGVALKEVGRTRCSLLYKRSELNLISKDVAFDPFRLSFFNRVHREPLQFLAWSQRYQASLANILKASDLSAIPGAIVDAAARLDAPVDTTLSTSFSPAAQEPLANAVAHLTKELGGTPDLTALKKDAADVPLALQKQVAQIVLAMTAAAKLRNEALGPVGRANARYYFDRIPFVVLPGFQRLSFGSPAAPSRDYEYLRKGFQAAKMYEGAWLLASAIATSGLQANASYKGFSFNQFTPIGRIIISDNADQVYSIQKAEYRGEIALVVDTGGNDTYEIAAGANSNHLNSVAVVIDLGGADTYGYEVNAHSADGTHRFPSDSGGRYSAPGFCQKDADCQNGGLCVHSACQKPCKVDADCANQGGTCRTEGYCKTLATAQGPFSLSNAARQGAGRLGIGMLIDLGGGKDEYRSLRMSQGFGALGVGILYDDGGDDLYQCEAGCQGSGVFGVGLLLERAGNDTYRTFTFAQGFGYVRGVGMLLDQAGDDRYLADHGNPKVDMYPGQKGDPLYLSAQLAGRANSSFVQGAGFGRRADFSDKMFMSGGIGVLYDQAGKDRYVAGVFGQGTGFWYGTGLLFDRDGDDLYDGFWYVQGATAHFALSALLEGAGHDKYNTILTPVATHTGVGHDFSTSFLVDDNGDDVYNTAGLTLGAGNENGYGFLIDNNGDDAYTSKNTNSMGRANSPNPDDNARNTSGVFSFGLFLDAAGTDIYKQGTGQSVVGNDKTWTQGRSAVTSPRRKLEHGVGIDGTGSSTLSAK
jgi:hypothetical protein